MYIKLVELKNWCQHASLTVELGPGLNGIIGSNGDGKSNLLDALRFAFTGESENAGGKADNLRWGAKQGHVRVVVGFGDTDYEIYRSIKTSQAWMKWKDPTGGEQKLTKVAEIQDQITALTGASSRALLDAVFVPQGKIDAVLFQRNSDRLKDFQRIFGLEVIADIYRYIGEEINLFHLTPDLEETLASAKKLLAVSQNEHDIMSKEIGGRKASIAAGATSEDVIRRFEAAQRHLEALNKAKAAVGSAQAAADEAAAILAPIAEAAASGPDPVALQSELQAASDAIAQHRSAVQQWEQAAALRQKLAEAETALAGIPEFVLPEKPVNPAVLQDAEAALAQAQAWAAGQRDPMPSEARAQEAYNTALERFNTISRSGSPVPSDEVVADLTREIEDIRREIGGFESGVCPTCGQEVKGGPEAMAEKLARAESLVTRRDERCQEVEQAYLAERKAAEDALNAAKAALDDITVKAREFFQKKWRDAQTWRDYVAAELQREANHRATVTAAQQLVDSIRQALVGAPEVAPDASEGDKALQTQAEVQKALKELQELSMAHEKAKAHHAATQSVLQRAVEAAETLSTDLDAPSDEEVAAAREVAEKVSQERQILADLQDAFLAMSVAVGNRSAEVERLSKQLAVEARQQAWVVQLREIRDAMHPSKLPSIIMGEYAKILNAQIGGYLDRWQAPFQFWLSEELAFRAIKPDDDHGMVEMDAVRLSGGEKIVAASSYRLGLSDTFARDAGLIVLDEPSNALDRENIKNLQQVLLHLRELSATTHRQVIVVTHEQSLIGFFDHIIEIGGRAALADG